MTCTPFETKQKRQELSWHIRACNLKVVTMENELESKSGAICRIRCTTIYLLLNLQRGKKNPY